MEYARKFAVSFGDILFEADGGRTIMDSEHESMMRESLREQKREKQLDWEWEKRQKKRKAER